MAAVSGIQGLIAILFWLVVVAAALTVLWLFMRSGAWAILLNGAVAVAGIAVISKWPGSGLAWLLGLALVAVGGLNCSHMIPKLIKYGDADHD